MPAPFTALQADALPPIRPPNPLASSPAAKRVWQASSWACLLCGLLLPALVWAAAHIRSSTSSVSQWLPSGGEQTRRYEQFLEWFGDDLFLEISWTGCKVGDQDLDRLATAIRARSAADPRFAVSRVITSTELVATLTQPPASLSLEQALARLRGVFVGHDETGVLLVQFSPGQQDLSAERIEVVLELARSTLALQRQDLRMGGSVYEAVYVDEASDRSLKRYVIPSALAALVVAWRCLGSFRLTGVILLIAGYCQLSSVALIYFCGGQLNAVLIVLPTLVFMLTVSASVHLVHYYREAGGDANPEAAVAAIRAGWMPCAMSSATTAVGLISLVISQLKPVRDFGLYSALAVLLANALLLAVFPFLVRLGARGGKRPTGHNHDSRQPSLQRVGMRILEFILQQPDRIASLSILAVLALACGLPLLQSTVKVQNMFSSRSEILQNYSWLEEHIGPLISVEAVVSFNAGCQLDDLQRAELVDRVHAAVANVPEVGGTLSPLSFMPDIPRAGGMGKTARRALFRKKLHNDKPSLVAEGFLATDQSGEHWRVTAKVPVIHNDDYGQLTDKIVAACKPISDALDPASGVQLLFTGLNPVFHEAQRLLFADLASSFLLAFAMIAPLMMLVLKNMWAGLLAMLPNVAPVAMVFGGLGWLGIPLDIASILTGSVALGIAVDDTLHFATWFARGRRAGMSTTDGTRFAFGRCATAMVQTTLIGCAAMLSFMPTEFLPTRKFAFLMSIMLAAAVVGDLILLPAILASRLGRLIPASAGNMQSLDQATRSAPAATCSGLASMADDAAVT